ncbi:hypothetical protein HYPSUDRAFT_49612 [Hypholoma sublateritium FD-334 SS-4]|uniref:F-box domain-containing protein n=1 Tax=Hypholoma sublateritium (strain FD-334 SS-4) TaxID=945553 RepID=A0A0D2NB60_HYPSF|nr:hypothetical protein HYPSUDRAFT_49612 [Hypholoma sublateritium FD-334 SS-4]
METPDKLPLDVLGYIADMLGTDIETNQDGFNALKMLCLTCTFMIPVCRRHLFARIRFPIFPRVSRRQNRLTQFLNSNPIIAHYVRNLHLNAAHPFIPLDYDFLQKICDSSSVTSLELSSSYSGDWTTLPERLKSITLSCIQIPTLRRLILDRIDIFPAAALSLCSGLKDLTFRGIYRLTPPDSNDVSRRPTITTLVSLTLDSYGRRDNALTSLMSGIGQNTSKAAPSYIVFEHLKSLCLSVYTQDDLPQMCELLERTTSLERLTIHATRRFVPRLTGLGSSLASNPYPKLRSVTLDLGKFHQLDNNSRLPKLNIELRQLSGKNIIEALEVKATGELDTLWTPDANNWAADFDQLVTDIGAFPVLRQVTISLLCNIKKRHDDHPWKMTESWFPRLLESTAIQFELCTFRNPY